MVKEINGMEEFVEVVRDTPDKLIVLDFFATWCGPCMKIGPEIDKLAEEFPNVVFRKINVDKNDEICSQLKISSMPTFMYFKNGKYLDKSIGAVLQNIRFYVEKFK